jgi:hypothetical protein
MSLDIFKKYATDESLENNGTWRDIGSGAKLLVARSGNKAYARALAKSYEQNRAALDLGDDSADAKSDEIMSDVIARTILLGWENVEYKGKPLDYSVVNATMLLKIRDFRRLVMTFAEDQESYLIKEEQTQGEA